MKARSGIASHCRECNNRWAKEHNSNPESKQKRKEAYKRNREKQLDQKLKREFGITYEQYRVRLDGQGGKCIICGKTPEQNGKMLAVDHDHTTGVVRDLLCNNCNACLGFIEKNGIDTDKLKWYLTKHGVINRK